MIRDEKYRQFVRQHPCCHCYRPADEAHHYGKRYAGGGMGIKPHDTFEVPLCTEHHDFVHCAGYLPEMTEEQTERHFLVTSMQILTEYLQLGSRTKNCRIPTSKAPNAKAKI